MRTVAEIKEEIKKAEQDERYSYPSAQVQINAPLALIQVSMRTRVGALKWVLGKDL